MYRHGRGVINGYAVVRFQGAQRDCVPCAHRDRCLRTPAKTKTRRDTTPSLNRVSSVVSQKFLASFATVCEDARRSVSTREKAFFYSLNDKVTGAGTAVCRRGNADRRPVDRRVGPIT